MRYSSPSGKFYPAKIFKGTFEQNFLFYKPGGGAKDYKIEAGFVFEFTVHGSFYAAVPSSSNVSIFKGSTGLIDYYKARGYRVATTLSFVKVEVVSTKTSIPNILTSNKLYY